MAQEAGRPVQEHEIEPVARCGAPQPVEEVSEGRLGGAGSAGTDQDRDVDIALRTLLAAGARAEEVGELDFGQRRQYRREPGDQCGITGGFHDVGRYHRVKAP